MKRRTFRKAWRDASGAAAIEFAIVGNAFLLLLFGTAYVSIMLWHEANLDWAVESGARVAVLNSSATQSDVATAVNGYLTSVGMAGDATVAYTTSTSGGVTVGQITATSTDHITVPFLSTYNITYQSSANVPMP
jgi:Flp pilus assembly protein TadG